jgi:hypothetical protein
MARDPGLSEFRRKRARFVLQRKYDNLVTAATHLPGEREDLHLGPAAAHFGHQVRDAHWRNSRLGSGSSLCCIPSGRTPSGHGRIAGDAGEEGGR